jgi:predicted nuclease with TOPRIM domain
MCPRNMVCFRYIIVNTLQKGDRNDDDDSDNNNNNNNNNTTNIAEYLNTNYKEDQFVNIVKNHESTQPNVNSIIKSAAKIIQELSQLNGKSDAKQDEIQHTKARLGEFLKKKWKNKVMHRQYIRNMDRQLISEEDTFL